MIDILLPYQMNNKGIELRMCLRGIEKHLSGAGNIFIVGDCPEWLTNIIHIPATDQHGNVKWKERNIHNKTIIACNDQRVSDDFLFMNDDHFLLSDYEVERFPYYWHSTVGNSAKRAEGNYWETLQNTLALFGTPGALDWDAHCPIRYNKEKYVKAFAGVDMKKPYGYALKSIYCNYNGVQGEFMEDCKVRKPTAYGELQWAIDGRRWFSVADKVLNDDMRRLLKDLYPEPSVYELIKQPK